MSRIFCLSYLLNSNFTAMISSQEFTQNELKNSSTNEHQLVLVYGYREQIESDLDVELIASKFPKAEIVITTTAGHVKNKVFHEEIVISAHHFEKTRLASFQIKQTENSSNFSRELIQSIHKEDLKALLIIADNTFGKSTEIIDELNFEFKGKVDVFGGLAGNLDLSSPSLTGLNSSPSENNLIVIAFYGNELKVHTNKVISSKPFGLDFTITANKGSKLLGLNGKNAYDFMYELFKAEDENAFQEKIMHYPFLVKSKNETRYVRSPIYVDHESKVLHYGGNFQNGDKVQLTRSDIIDGLEETEKQTKLLATYNPQLIFLTSCYGRRLFLNELIEDEIESVKKSIDVNTKLTGFYSYAEFLSEKDNNNICEIHNNSIALVGLSE